MSFCFNFEIPSQKSVFDNVDRSEIPIGKKSQEANRDDDNNPAELIKEAKEHFPPNDPQSLLVDGVFETVTIGTLPPLHFLNETVFEKTASERADEENILSRREEQRSDLIPGVYEGGLKVWECTYDLLELIDREGETFQGKTVLDLGCGAGLLGVLALKRGAAQVYFQDYNSTVIEQVTVPNVMLNCQEDDEVDSDCEMKGKGKGKKQVEDAKQLPKKKAVDLSQNLLMKRSHFFSGDWTTFLPLVLEKKRQPKFDIILTSETIYNTLYYSALHESLHKLLAPDGQVYLATKSHYFGVGGGLHLFETFVHEKGVFSLDRLWNAEEGLQRHVVMLCFKKQSDP